MGDEDDGFFAVFLAAQPTDLAFPNGSRDPVPKTLHPSTGFPHWWQARGQVQPFVAVRRTIGRDTDFHSHQARRFPATQQRAHGLLFFFTP